MLIYVQFKAKLHESHFLPGEGRELQFSLAPLPLSSLSYKMFSGVNVDLFCL